MPILYVLGSVVCFPIIVIYDIIYGIIYGVKFFIILSMRDDDTISMARFIIFMPLVPIICVYTILWCTIIYTRYMPQTLKKYHNNLKCILKNDVIDDVISSNYWCPTCLGDEINHYNSFWKAFRHMYNKCNWSNVGTHLCP